MQTTLKVKLWHKLLGHLTKAYDPRVFYFKQQKIDIYIFLANLKLIQFQKNGVKHHFPSLKTYPLLIVKLVLIPQKPMAYYIAKDIRKQKNFAIM